jgi:hypothetical protein
MKRNYRMILKDWSRIEINRRRIRRLLLDFVKQTSHIKNLETDGC